MSLHSPLRRSVGLGRILICPVCNSPPQPKRGVCLPQDSWLILSASALAKVGNPLDDLTVIRCEPAVLFVLLQRARVISEVQIAHNAKVPVRIWEIRRLRERLLITGARFRKIFPAAVQQSD